MHLSKETTLSQESIGKFRGSCIARGRSQNTAKAYSTDLRMLLEFHGLETISVEDFDTMSQIWLNETRVTATPRTTGRRLTSLRAFARWAKWPTELSDYKAPTPGKTLPHPLPERLEGLERLLTVAANSEQRALIGACGFIGLRISEALAFNTNWFNANEMTLRVRGKGDKERIVPVSLRAWNAISEAYVTAMQGDGKVLHYQDRSARSAITAMGQRASLSRQISSHDLRATYATILTDKGVNIRVVQELLGHSSVATTEIYTGVEMNAMRQAVDF